MFAALRTSAAVRCGSFGSPNAASAQCDIRARRACSHSSTLLAWMRGHCVEAQRLTLSLRPIARSGQDQEPSSTGRHARTRKGCHWARGSCERYGRIIPAPYKKPCSRATGLGCWQLQPQGVAPVSPWEHDSSCTRHFTATRWDRRVFCTFSFYAITERGPVPCTVCTPCPTITREFGQRLNAARRLELELDIFSRSRELAGAAVPGGARFCGVPLLLAGTA